MKRSSLKEGATFNSLRYGLCVVVEVIVEGFFASCLFLEAPKQGPHSLWFHDAPSTQHMTLCLDELELVGEGI